MKLTYNIVNRGGPSLTGTGMTPIDMGYQFGNWSSGFAKDESTAAGIRMVWRNWFDLDQVQTIITTTKNVTLLERFTQAPPPTSVFQLMTQAYSEYNQIRETLTQTLQWSCAKKNAAYKKQLEDMRDQLTTEITNIEYYNEDDVRAIAEQIRAGNFTWFINHNDALWEQLDTWQTSQCNYNMKYYKEAYPNQAFAVNGQCTPDGYVVLQSKQDAEMYLNDELPLLSKAGIAVIDTESDK